MEINSAAPASSTWKLNKPKVISKPPIFVEVDPVEHEMGSSIATAGVLMATIGSESTMVGEAVSTTVGEAVSTMVGEAVSTMIGEAVSMMVGEAVSMMIGEAVSMMVGEAVSMSMGNAESMAGAGDEPATVGDTDELMEIVDAGESAMVGEGAGESIDPDPVIPTVGAN
jgi:hypothetical protein